MSKEDMIKMIELIDEELKKNEEFINKHCHNVNMMILCKTSELLRESRKAWVDMLWYEHNVFYTG